jgi:hypothetical protein
MVAQRQNFDRTRNAGFALAELMISCAVFATVSMGLYMAFTSLSRSYSATTDFAINHADQMRISDYLALDFRRAVAVTVSTNDTTVTIPNYYDNSGTTPLLPALYAGGVFYTATDMTGKTIRNGSGAPASTIGADGDYYVDDDAFALYGPKTTGAWGAATPLATNIRYYLQGDTIFRQEGSKSPIALASSVSDFHFYPTNPTDPAYLGKAIKLQITFNPTYRLGSTSAAVTLATSFYNTTLLRNSRRDRVSSLY